MASLEEAKQILKRETNNRSVYDHLSEVLLKVLVDKPADALDGFEHISASIKRLALAPKPVPDYADDVDDAQTTRITKTKQLQWAKASSALLKKPDEPAADGYPPYPDLVSDATLYEWAGVSFGQEETYRLFLAIKTFAETLPAEHAPLRFFGRVTTRTTAYYVLEGATFEDPEVDPELQEGMMGANKHTYWVARHAGDTWVKLPPVTSAQVVAARKITHYLTGDLEAPVPGYPPFPGIEKHYLAVQLTRITASTAVSPAGFFALDEDSEVPLLKPADDEAINETFPKAAEELKTPDAWVHHELEVNAIGRVRPLPEKEDEEGNPIERDNPESSEALKSLAEDAEGSWTFRVGPGGAGENGQSTVVARSLVWPGASAVAVGKRWTVVYSGDAVKYRPAPYIVDSPPAIQPEWAPAEGEEESEALVESEDLLTDPTPPAEEGEAEE